MATKDKGGQSTRRSTGFRSHLRGIVSRFRGKSKPKVTKNEENSPLHMSPTHLAAVEPVFEAKLKETASGPDIGHEHPSEAVSKDRFSEGASAPPANERLQIPTLPPSQIDELIGTYPRFRIVVIGKSGVGKSSIIQHIFNVQNIDVADGRAGEAKIDHEWTSESNPRFILHDSVGFEPGSSQSWDTVETFLKSRVRPELDVSKRIHAVWFCMETPRFGGRLLQDGDERLLNLSSELKIPMIAVFTKYNFLVNQFLVKLGREGKSGNDLTSEAEIQASKSFDKSENDLKGHMELKDIQCVRVEDPKSDPRGTVLNLTMVTQNVLREVEGELWVPWALAQQRNAHQKVEVSIKKCFEKYIHDKVVVATFKGSTLLDCILRIHDDVLKIWNFNDPRNILGGTELFAEMINLAKIEEVGDSSPSASTSDQVGAWNSAASLVGALPGSTYLSPAFAAISLSAIAAQYLYGEYRNQETTTNIMKTYIINLIRLLYAIFNTTIAVKAIPRVIERATVFDELRILKDKISAGRPHFPSRPDGIISFITRET